MGKVVSFWLCLGIVQILNRYIQAWPTPSFKSFFLTHGNLWSRYLGHWWPFFLHPSFCNSYFGHFFTGSQTDPCFLNKNSGADWPGEWTKMVNSIRRFFMEKYTTKYLELTVVFLVYFFSNQVICIKSLNIKLSLIYNNQYLPKCTK